MKKEKRKQKSVEPTILSHIPYQYLLVALFASIVYRITLNADFVYDDRPAILTNDDVLGRTPWRSLIVHNDFWGNPIGLQGSHKSYRPLITASFRLQFAVHGLKAELFHGVNLICHMINSMLVLKLARQMRIMGNEFSLLSALIFACHPITSEAVCSIVGRADLLSTMLILLAITCHTSDPSTFRTIVLSILAVTAKETGIILLPLITLYDVLFKTSNTKQFRRDVTAYLISLLALCYLRLSINNFQSPKFSKNDNPIAHEPNSLTRALTFMYLPVFHLNLIVFPKTLSYDWSMDAIPKVESLIDSRIILTFIVIGVGEHVLLKLLLGLRNSENSHENRSLLFLFALFTTPHILSSNLLTHVGFVAAERILYLNTVAYCILAAFLAEMCSKRSSPKSVLPLYILLLSLFTIRTMQRVDDWKTEESLFKSALEVNPTKANMNLGYVYTTQKKYELAKYHYRQALKRQGNLADAWYNLGILTSKTSNNSNGSIHCYQMALQSRSTYAAAHLNLALLLHDAGHHMAAFSHLDKCLNNTGEFLKFYHVNRKTQATCAFNKGRLLQKSGNFHVAIENFELALKLGGPHFEHTPSVLNSMGTCYNELGDEQSAEKFFGKAIGENHVNSYLTMAHLKIRQNRSFEVENLLRKAMTLAPESVTVLQNIALAEFHMQNYNRSLLFYRKALHLDPTHLDSLQGIANLLQQTQNHVESETFYRKVMEAQPNSYAAHANYGAILHLNQKYDLALKEYEIALILDPTSDVARENRKKVIRILRRKRNL
ncbi:dolichyl-phosphate-mannose--protein mannosyltransferase [Caenorhabditis elegans]|uniref:dolichyl-phosphate-mannose--protein mannosyltransferase n=2 Tax=Caenorhabditis elegans TaxID=6239 RepID=O16296_CAEEL|nr:dolichyl-phosphate-mannose--protein mannosyltransferase [Caenorhabditis elegans]CCD68483.1 dolichyl-phosphate-mannose--protein mannosyltransferase [Caenorhabditis elegans]|eukprot:NP_504200.1 Uncharacterized protein CELE_F32D1.3 [Caenorhabditis elegans]